MRLLLLTADYPPNVWSGIGVTVERQAQALAALGIDVHVLCRAGCGVETQFPVDGRPVVHSLDKHHCPVHPADFDLVHLHSLALSELALEMCRRFRLPLIYTAHSLIHLELEDTPVSAWWREVQRTVMAASDQVVLLSNAEHGAAVSFMPDLERRSTVIPNGVEPFHKAPSSMRTGPIVFAGRFAKSKGIELLAELIPCVLAQRRYSFVLAGGHSDETGDSTIRYLKTHFASHCHITRWLRPCQIERLLAAAQLVLVPSLYEPFGLTALESMRVGTPVLAAAVGGLVELILPAPGGGLVHAHDPSVWSQAIFEMTSEPVTPEMRRQLRAYVAANFDIAQIARRLREEVYAVCQCTSG